MSAPQEQQTLQRVSSVPWGKVGKQQVTKYTLRNFADQEVDVITYGATITAVRTHDRNGKFADVVLGYDNIEGYLSEDNPYFGATIGRVANRIRDGKFRIDDVEYNVNKNLGNHTLHGGNRGWSHQLWDSYVQNNTVVMTLLSPDQDEGFPGTVIASVSFQLKDDGNLIVIMKAFPNKATPINMTNHSYFNLAGHQGNSEELMKHLFIICADRYTAVDEERLPTGELKLVDNSRMDVRTPTVLGYVINDVYGGGFDHNYGIANFDMSGPEERFIAEFIHPESGRSLEVFTNQPGVQFYTSNMLPKSNSGNILLESDPAGIVGKGGVKYFKHAAFCLETQGYPDAMNHANFPSILIRPGQVYNHVVRYKFGVK